MQKTIIFIYLYTSSMYRAEALQQLGKQKKFKQCYLNQ